MKTPLAVIVRLLVLLCLIALLSGCATTVANRPPEEPAMHSLAEFGDDEKMLYVEDSWERFNRKMYKFNYYADKYFLLPIVNSYEFITPVIVQDGVSNFFNNIDEIRTIYNSLLQAKGKKSLNALGRFAANSTIGLAGLFDVAKSMGLERQPEDFGQTLGAWGVGTGPYIVLPVLGPSTGRDTTGFLVDSGVRKAMVSAVDPYGSTAVEAGVTALEAIDTRHQVSFRYYDSGYPFEYYMVRYLYKQKREFDVMK